MSEAKMNIYRGKSVKFAFAVCAAGLLFTGLPTVRAENPDSARDYIRDATQEVIGDAAINRIVRDKGEHEEIRHYADERVRMDEILERDLRDFAERHHIGVPGKDEVARGAQDRLDRLRTSDHFDREYLGGEVKDSEVMTKLFRNASDAEAEPEVRDWFVKKTHTLKDRHKEVVTLNDQFDK